MLYFDGGYVYSTNAQSLIRYLVNFSDLDNAPKPIAEITMVAHIDEPVMSIIDPEMRERTWMAFYYYPSDVTFESASFGSGRIMNAAARDNSTYTYQYFITDHLGSTRMVVDGNGVPLEATEYYPYGTMVPVTPSANPEVPAREQFTGKEFDTEGEDVANGAPGIQCYYFGARYYDPELGVWGSCDKAGQFASGYGYGTNPVIFVDPDGNWFLLDDAIAAGIGFAVGYVGYGLATGEWGGRAFAMGGIGAAAGLGALYTGGATAAAFGSGFGATVASGAAAGAVAGAISGAGNYSVGAAYGDYAWNAGDFFSATGKSALTGAATGAISGAAMYGLQKGASALADKSFQTASDELDDLTNPEFAYSEKVNNALDPMTSQSDAVTMTEKYRVLAKISTEMRTTNTELDAFRHQYWQAKLTSGKGALYAKILGNFHEIGRADFLATNMDIANNQIGRSLVQRGSKDVFGTVSNNMLKGNWVNYAGYNKFTGLRVMNF